MNCVRNPKPKIQITCENELKTYFTQNYKAFFRKVIARKVDQTIMINHDDCS